MIRLIYSGSVAAEPDAPRLEAFLADCRRRNQRDGITGVMVLMGQEFLQVIEGPEEDVDRYYRQVFQDSTRYKLLLLARQEIDAPIFTGWSLGLIRGDETPNDPAPGDVSIMDIEQIDPADLNGKRTLSVIREFIDGKWRVRFPSSQKPTIMQRTRGF
ncbi:BLUF domain-containing protein [Paludibacterium purpuratum]|uniref:FAD-dependent sensor of blue light n=1 Tax=Paludibacterium purpuratum TaxID=1144873 RepID=A0A4R7BCL7_9NEIS|nr:BLUF domain-containing protein [Paludibacterium purpuratum]TDR82810.1 FAD-dependent sensor of blue light [Paludibacterium purpuratum]